MKLNKLFPAFLLVLVWMISLRVVQAQPNLDNMFLYEDTDSFDPGLSIGSLFPEIRAIYGGQEITRVSQFYGEKGLVVFAIRSVDW